MKTLKKWGKPVTEVQRFVPQYCQSPCRDQYNHLIYEIECGQGITSTNGFPDWVTQYLTDTSGGVSIHKESDHSTVGQWNKCPVTHTFTKEELANMWVYIGPKNTQTQDPIHKQGHLFGWYGSYSHDGQIHVGAHIFYLDNIDGEEGESYEKTHS